MTRIEANDVEVGQTVRVLTGPKAGHEGVVDDVRRATQFRSTQRTVIIDFVGGGRTVRQPHDTLEVLS